MKIPPWLSKLWYCGHEVPPPAHKVENFKKAFGGDGIIYMTIMWDGVFLSVSVGHAVLHTGCYTKTSTVVCPRNSGVQDEMLVIATEVLKYGSKILTKDWIKA